MAKAKLDKRGLKKAWRAIKFVFSPFFLFALPAHIATNFAKKKNATRKYKIIAWVLCVVTALLLMAFLAWAFFFALTHKHGNPLKIAVLLVGCLSAALLIIDFSRITRWYIIVPMVLAGLGCLYYVYRTTPPYYYQAKVVVQINKKHFEHLMDFLEKDEGRQRINWSWMCESEIEAYPPVGNMDCVPENDAKKYRELLSSHLNYFARIVSKFDNGVNFYWGNTEKFHREMDLSTIFYRKVVWTEENLCKDSFWKTPYGDCIEVLDDHWAILYSWRLPQALNQEEFAKIIREEVDKDETKYFRYFNDITDLSPLTGLSNLEYLEIGGVKVTDYTPLSRLKKLKTLVISYSDPPNCLKDLSQLRGLEQLEYLYIEQICIEDLSPIKSFPNLKELYIRLNKIQDLSPLTALKKLESLDIDGNGIFDLSQLAGMDKLREIVLSGKSAVGVKSLAQLKGLRRVSTTVNNASDVVDLTKVKNLEELSLHGDGIDGYAMFFQLPNLRKLMIFGNRKLNLSTISGLSGLESLGLLGLEVENLEPISKIRNLKEFSIFGTKIAEGGYSPLAKLKNLRIIRADNHKGLREIFKGRNVEISWNEPEPLN